MYHLIPFLFLLLFFSGVIGPEITTSPDGCCGDSVSFFCYSTSTVLDMYWTIDGNKLTTKIMKEKGKTSLRLDISSASDVIHVGCVARVKSYPFFESSAVVEFNASDCDSTTCTSQSLMPFVPTTPAIASTYIYDRSSNFLTSSMLMGAPSSEDFGVIGTSSFSVGLNGSSFDLPYLDTSLLSPTNSPSNTPTNNPTKDIHVIVGVIIGVVLGCFIFGTVVIIYCFIQLRRKKQQWQHRGIEESAVEFTLLNDLKNGEDKVGNTDYCNTFKEDTCEEDKFKTNKSDEGVVTEPVDNAEDEQPKNPTSPLSSQNDDGTPTLHVHVPTNGAKLSESQYAMILTSGKDLPMAKISDSLMIYVDSSSMMGGLKNYDSSTKPTVPQIKEVVPEANSLQVIDNVEAVVNKSLSETLCVPAENDHTVHEYTPGITGTDSGVGNCASTTHSDDAATGRRSSVTELSNASFEDKKDLSLPVPTNAPFGLTVVHQEGGKTTMMMAGTNVVKCSQHEALVSAISTNVVQSDDCRSIFPDKKENKIRENEGKADLIIPKESYQVGRSSDTATSVSKSEKPEDPAISTSLIVPPNTDLVNDFASEESNATAVPDIYERSEGTCSTQKTGV